MSDRPWEPHTCLMKLTCAGVRKKRCREGKPRCGSESCGAFLRSPRPLSRLEEAVNDHWQHGGNGSKINCVCLNLSQSASWRLWQAGVSQEDQRSMLCCISLVILPVSHWNYISQVSTRATNLCTINQEMCLGLIISLIVGGVINISRVATGLTDARFLACWSQQHSALNDFLLSQPHSFFSFF